MATNEELENQRNLNQQKTDTNRLDNQNNQFAAEAARAAAARVDFARSLTEELKDQLNIRSRSSEADKAQLSLSRRVASAALENNVILGNSKKLHSEILKDEKTLSDIQTERQSLINSIGGENSRAFQIAQQIKDIQIEQHETLSDIADLEQQILQTRGALKDNLVEQQIQAEESLGTLDSRLANLLTESDAIGTLSKKEIDRLAVLSLMEQNQKNVLISRREESKIQEKINQNMGVTGSIIEGIGGIMQRIGLRSGIFNDAMTQAKDAMEDIAEEAARTNTSVSRTAVALAGFSKMGSVLKGALTDPLTIALALLDTFLTLDKAAVDFTRMTGQTEGSMAGVNTEASTLVDLMATATDLTREIGLNATAIFTPKQIGQISDAVQLLGLGAAAAGRLGVLMNVTGKSTDQINKNVTDSVKSFNAQNKAAIAPRQVLDDILTTSEDVSLALGNSVPALAKAASAARKLGMSLAQVDAIADSLMDFESSIQNELEAQLLTGKNINMAKARELALNNDLAGLASELANSGVTAAEYSKMNRIQQEALAKSLGMSKKDLAKSLLTQEAMANMTEEQIAAARGVSLEESKRISVQERIQKAVQNLMQQLAPLLEMLVPILSTAAEIIQPVAAFVGMLAKGLAAVIKFPPVLFAIKAAMIGIAAVKAFNFAGQIAQAAKNAGKYARMLQALTAAKKAGNLADLHGNTLAKQALKMNRGEIVVGKVKMGIDKAKLALQNTISLAKETYNKIIDGTIWRTIKEKSAIVGSYIAEKTKNGVIAIGNAIRGISNRLQNISILGYLKEKASIIGSYIAEKVNNAVKTISNSLRSASNALQNISILNYLREKIAIAASTVATYANTAAQSASNAVKAISNSIRSTSNALQNISILNYLREKAAVVGSTIATYANTAAQTAWNAVKNLQIVTMVKSAAYWIAEKARMIADTAARWLNVGATAAQTAARGTQAAVNTTLAGSQSAVAASSGGMAAGLAAAGAALGAFGVAAAPAIPVILAIGAAILMSAPAIYALGKMITGIATVIGNVLMKALEMLPSIITAVSNGFKTMLEAVTLERVGALFLLGPAFASIGVGLMALSAAALYSLPALGVLGALALMGSGLEKTANSLTTIASSIKQISDAISNLELAKIEELQDLISTSAMAAPALAAAGAISQTISAVGGTNEKESSANTDAKLDELIAAVRAGQIVKVYTDPGAIKEWMEINTSQSE